MNLSILNEINPAKLSYDEWLAVGMAIHHEGGQVGDWIAWSRRDAARFRDGECARKWAGFHGAGSPVTGGTLVELAKQQGWMPLARDLGHALGWDDVIERPDDGLCVLDQNWIEDVDLQAPDAWDPVHELSTYLSTLFASDEYVGYCVEAWKTEDKPGEPGKWLPKKGAFARTAGELLDALGKCGGDLGKAIGDYNPEVGAWIRFNPLDGKGVSDANVTAFRYALVECDDLPIERQAAIYRDLELPVAILVHSGSRSLHAIVKIDAGNIEEYRERVNFLFKVLEKNGCEKKARANRNPSRLSRMPGVIRGNGRQYIVGLAQGKASWDEWRAYIEEANDNLPDVECLADVFDNLPPLAPSLIEGVLRMGHKLLLAGPSKAGKSFMLLQLAVAIAEGRDWLGWKCAQGRVMYVNLELDRTSCLHRAHDLYAAKGWAPKHILNFDAWHLRGKAVPMDVLAPMLIRRAMKKRYVAIIIDPIYKVITGDENAADKMAHFCNQFDRVCTELGCAVIYCHHHSKGAQGAKAARDRSSGSGVFARDPDALLDVIELAVGTSCRKQKVNKAVCAAVSRLLDAAAPGWERDISQDDALVADKLVEEARRILGPGADDLDTAVALATVRAGRASGWRVEGTLREFAPFEPRRLWFEMPLHIPDDGLLTDAKADGEEPPWRVPKEEKAKAKDDRKRELIDSITVAYNALAFDGADVTTELLATHMGIADRTARKYVQMHPRLASKLGKITWTDE